MSNVIAIFSSLITTLGILFAVNNFSGEKVSIIKKIFFTIILSSVLLFLSFNTTDNFIKLILNYLSILFSIYFFLLDKNIKKALAYSASVYVLTVIIEMVLSIVMKMVTNFDALYNKYEISVLIFSIIVNILLVILSKTKVLNKTANKIIVSNFVLKLILYFIVILSTLIVIQNKNLVNTQSIYFIVNTLMFVFVVIITFVIIDVNNKNSQINNKYNQMMEYMTEYENIIDEQGKKNHEYNNQLMILKGFIDDKKKLRDYLQTIIDDHKTGQNYEIRQLSHFPNGGLKGLLYYKLAKMKENDIKYFLYVSKETKKPLEKLDLTNYKDISKIFGVLIDNAIDATLKSDKKEIMLDFKMDDDYLVITISNSYKSNVDISKLGTGFSSKGKGHGFGLRLVKDIIKNNSNLELITEKTSTEIIQTLLIDTK